MCFEEEENVHERIAVAVTSMERFVLDHLQREISNLLRLFVAWSLVCVSCYCITCVVTTAKIAAAKLWRVH